MRKKIVIPMMLVLLSPLGLFLLCFANPMLLMFLEPVNISNQSKEELHAIPMGRREGGTPGLPPLYWTRAPAALPRSNTELIIAPGESTSFIYDWDDINLCWLLVRTGSSTWKVAPSSLSGPSCALTPRTDGGCCFAVADGFAFRVGELAKLPDAPAWLVSASGIDGGY